MPERRPSLMQPRMENLLAREDSKFTLVTLAAKRAREINDYYNQLGEGLGKIVPPQAIETYSIRVRALAGAYDALLAEERESGNIRDVIERAVAPHHDPGDTRFRLDGPVILLPPKAVVALSLVLHELATNATKYGALSVAAGHVDLTWRTVDERIHLDWIEHGGPAVAKPEREGFGTKVVSRAFSPEFESEVVFDYRPDGLRFSLAFKQAPAPAE